MPTLKVSSALLDFNLVNSVSSVCNLSFVTLPLLTQAGSGRRRAPYVADVNRGRDTPRPEWGASPPALVKKLGHRGASARPAPPPRAGAPPPTACPLLICFISFHTSPYYLSRGVLDERANKTAIIWNCPPPALAGYLPARLTSSEMP
ncbi:hypothetical protein EVAR_63972_1 [Eumeta japonica]|uniref:Uncharacterized protein n=1 Tax=Eumeta variegata TaxID=151549 RepID=A0A4C1ZC87_EUMVA|nr:hypothetical protein EVAR_63972_1 [Eumeta japonica]